MLWLSHMLTHTHSDMLSTFDSDWIQFDAHALRLSTGISFSFCFLHSEPVSSLSIYRTTVLVAICCLILNWQASRDQVAATLPVLQELALKRPPHNNDVLSLAGTHLIAFNGARCSRWVNDQLLATLLSQCPALKRLNLSRSYITDESLVQLATHRTALETLVLRDCEMITDACIADLVDSKVLMELRHLDLWGCAQLTEQWLLDLVGQCSLLQVLQLGCCSIVSDKILRQISQTCLQLTTLGVTCFSGSLQYISILCICRGTLFVFFSGQLPTGLRLFDS